MTNSRLFIIHQGAFGDVVLTFASIIALHKQFGRIDILCQNQIGKLAAKLGVVDTSYPLEAAYVATLFTGQVDSKIKGLIRSYAKILVFSFSAELENTINRIAARPCLRIPPRPPARDSIHVAEFLMQNLIAGGLIEMTDANEAVTNWQQEKARTAAGLIDSSKIILHPGAGSMRKRWPLDRFLELADVLAERRLQPQFVCGPAEPDLTAELQRQDQNVKHLHELTALVELLQSAGGFVGNDSGVSHLAAFLGVPSVVIFGPADPVRWRPLGHQVEIVRPELDCRPCFEIEPENCAEPACLADASVESVLKAFHRLVKHE